MNYTTNIEKVLSKTELTLKLYNFEDATNEVLNYIISIEQENQCSLSIEQKSDELFNIIKDTYTDKVEGKESSELEEYFSTVFKQVVLSDEIANVYGKYFAVYYTVVCNPELMSIEKVEVMKDVCYNILSESAKSRIAIESTLLDLLLSARPMDMNKIKEVNEDVKRLLELNK